jgi:hypothetical protein
MLTTTMSQVPVNAFMQAEYHVQDAHNHLILHVGRYSKALQEIHLRFGASSSAFITACNPLSVIQNQQQNENATQSLQQVLLAAGYRSLPATGRDPKSHWPDEPGFLVIDITCNQALKIAAKYQQLAILFNDSRAIPKLEFTDNFL